MKLIYSAAFAALVLTACQSTEQQSKNNNANSEQTAESLEDSLFKEVVAVHDEVMPKMGKVIGYKKTMIAKIDSIDHLKGKAQAEAAADKKKYQNVLAQLASAEKGMNDWMEQFDWEKKLVGKEDMVKYYGDQKEKAAKMKDDLLAALQNAAGQ